MIIEQTDNMLQDFYAVEIAFIIVIPIWIKEYKINFLKFCEISLKNIIIMKVLDKDLPTINLAK